MGWRTYIPRGEGIFLVDVGRRWGKARFCKYHLPVMADTGPQNYFFVYRAMPPDPGRYTDCTRCASENVLRLARS